MQSAQKASATEGELRLKRTGRDKFNIAQNLTAGREFLDVVSERDTTARNAERIRSNQAVELGGIDLKQSAAPRFVDARTAANSGVAARATSEEDSFNATSAILNADLGISSSVSSSNRTLAQSEQQLQEAVLRKKMSDRANTLELGGAIAGGIASTVDFSSVDPLANPNQIRPDFDGAFDAPIAPPRLGRIG